MSYSIIFETIIVKLADGRVMHLDRSGCNNDNAGRQRNDFTAKIYTVEDFIAKAESYKANHLPYAISQEFEMKILGRPATLYDYGEHLLRMLRRAKTWEETIAERYAVSIRYCEEVEVLVTEPDTVKSLTDFNVTGSPTRVMSLKDFNDQFYKLLYSGNGLSYRLDWIPVDKHNEAEIVSIIESDKAVEISISSRRQC